MPRKKLVLIWMLGCFKGKQRQELLDKIQRLESEVEFLRKQQTQHVAQLRLKSLRNDLD